MNLEQLEIYMQQTKAQNKTNTKKSFLSTSHLGKLYLEIYQRSEHKNKMLRMLVRKHTRMPLQILN